MEQLIYMCSCFYRPKLSEGDFFSLKILRFLVNPPIPLNIRKQALLLFLYLFFTVIIFAQQKITGVVIGVNNLPLSGANVTLKGSRNATTTNADGVFVVNAKPEDALIISFVGYDPREIAVGAATSLKVSLALSANDLDEVVVTGYTAQRIKEISGSVSSVKSKDLVSVPAGQVEQMLQGRAAGLTVITSGEPGAESQVYLHGPGNFGNVKPLYIIDGVEGDVNSINPYDVESIQVLKDAGVYSIYGVRGANGVIVVTTKKGKGVKPKLSYDFYIGTTRPLSKGLDVLNPQEQADLKWLALKNSGQPLSDALYGSGQTPILPEYLYAGPYIGLPKGDARADVSHYNIDSTAGPIYAIVPFNKEGTDWFHELFKPATTQNHTITVSGGGDKGHYLVSFGYLNQQGTYLNTYLKRFTTRINTEFTLLNSVRIGENLQLSYSENPRVGSIDPALSYFPFLPVYDIKGNSASYGPSFGSGYQAPGPASNPVTARILSKDDKYNNWEVFGNAFAEFDFLKDFTFRTSFGGPLNYHYYYNFSYGSYEPPPPSALGSPNSFSESSGYSSSWTWTNTLNYFKTFKDHHLKALVGTEEKSNYSRELGGKRIGYASNSPSYRFLNTGRPTGLTNYSFGSTSYLYSFLSQVEYSYMEKYFLRATMRGDESSVFGSENRLGWFPAVSAAWRLTEEDFLRNIEWLKDFKLRGSWGKTGFDGNTDPSNQYTLYGGGAGASYYDIYGNNVGNIDQGFRPVRFGNARTSWQEDIVTNIGLDAVFWNGELSLTADWYNKNSTGLLFPLSLPALLGEATPPNVNVGDVKNYGIDLTIGSKGRFSKNSGWDILITFSHYNNKILKLNDVPFFDQGIVRNEVGYPISSFFGYKVIGFFEDDADVAKSPDQTAAAPGRFKYLDANGDHRITGDDRVHFGNPNPTFTMGLNLGFHYRNFDFSTFFYGSFGNDVFNDYKSRLNIYGYGGPNGKTALYDSWTPGHHNATAPIQEINSNFSNGSNGGVPTSYNLEDGSYFRNKTMIIGYNLPKSLLEKIKVERFRVYIQAVNLFTITNYSGLDPELSGRNSSAFGIDYFGNYPNNQKQYVIGFNLGF